MRTLWAQIKMALRNRSRLDDKAAYSAVDLDLLCTLFGTEEAKRHLLNIVPAESIKPEQVLKDAQAMELMLRTYPWRLYEQAVWRSLLTALRQSLASESAEKRDAARSRVLAHLNDLHLPYELRFEKERIEKMRELTRVAQEKM